MGTCKLTLKPELKGYFLYSELINIYDYVVNISPENRSMIEIECNKGLEIKFSDCIKVKAKTNTSERYIIITIGLIERLWASCFASYYMYQKLLSGNKCCGTILFDPKDPIDNDLKKIISISARQNTLLIEERNILIYFYNKYKNGKYFDASAELFRMSFAFIVLHELAHIALNHTGHCDNDCMIDMEKDADTFAYEHVMSPLKGLDASNLYFKKRILGIIHANLFLVFMKLCIFQFKSYHYFS